MSWQYAGEHQNHSDHLAVAALYIREGREGKKEKVPFKDTFRSKARFDKTHDYKINFGMSKSIWGFASSKDTNKVMGISIELIIFSLFSLHLLSISNGNNCDSMSCRSGPSLRYPFYVKGGKPNPCDTPGFDVYCGDKYSQSLLELPSAGNFSIRYIYSFTKEIQLSDPDGCLPQKLMLLDPNNLGPFRLEGPYGYYSPSFIQYLRLYNCSQIYFDDYISYDKVDCLSRSGYTVISTVTDTSISNCTYLKTLPYGYNINTMSSIWLTWNQTLTKCPSCDGYTPPSDSDSGSDGGVGLGLGLGFGLPLVIILCIFTCLTRCCKEPLNQTDSNNSDTVSGLQTQSRAVTASTGGGLDQVTIDSYPVVVIGQSGRLIKPDDDTCPICLSDYAPHDILKMLPECLHRFHSDCIDQWLRAKAVCPICRVSPSGS